MKIKNNTVSVSLLISTYNWEEALSLCLKSVLSQTRLPDEIIIADDGSNNNTYKLIKNISVTSSIPIHHVWHKDDGFRKTIILNKAIARCTKDYIIQIDGDIILNKHFVQDQLDELRPGYYLNGSRGKINYYFTNKYLKEGIFNIHFYSPGIYRKLNVIRLPFLTRFFYHYKEHAKERGCNMSFWRSDIIAINGYDERIIGYGYEDIDIGYRLRRLGLQKRFVKFKAIEFHLHHKNAETKNNMNHNQIIFDENNRMGIIKSPLGVNQYLK